jgi:hypothetical protein
MRGTKTVPCASSRRLPSRGAGFRACAELLFASHLKKPCRPIRVEEARLVLRPQLGETGGVGSLALECTLLLISICICKSTPLHPRIAFQVLSLPSAVSRSSLGQTAPPPV